MQTTTTYSKVSDTEIQRVDTTVTTTTIEVSDIQAALDAAIKANQDRDDLYTRQKVEMDASYRDKSSALDTDYQNDSVVFQKAIADAQANLDNANILISK